MKSVHSPMTEHVIKIYISISLLFTLFIKEQCFKIWVVYLAWEFTVSFFYFFPKGRVTRHTTSLLSTTATVLSYVNLVPRC